MPELGKPLVFHLKYLAEMYRLHNEAEDDFEAADFTGLADVDQVQKMAHVVGDLADEEAAEFLELCGRRIEEHFSNVPIATIVKKRGRPYVRRNWCWEVRIADSSVPGGWFWCGLFISAPPEIQVPLAEDVFGFVIPYVWTKGSRKGSDAVWKVVGEWADSREGEGLVWEKGTVALARIPIKARVAGSFDVDRDWLVSEVMKTIAHIGVKETTDIAIFVAGLTEPDEA